MTQVLRLWPLLTATHRYDKSLSTRNHGQGQVIEAPILAYLIETANGRILYDVGCDYSKIADPLQREFTMIRRTLRLVRPRCRRHSACRITSHNLG